MIRVEGLYVPVIPAGSPEGTASTVPPPKVYVIGSMDSPSQMN